MSRCRTYELEIEIDICEPKRKRKLNEMSISYEREGLNDVKVLKYFFLKHFRQLLYFKLKKSRIILLKNRLKLLQHHL